MRTPEVAELSKSCWEDQKEAGNNDMCADCHRLYAQIVVLPETLIWGTPSPDADVLHLLAKTSNGRRICISLTGIARIWTQTFRSVRRVSEGETIKFD